jgi:hypothetical protein
MDLAHRLASAFVENPALDLNRLVPVESYHEIRTLHFPFDDLEIAAMIITPFIKRMFF